MDIQAITRNHELFENGRRRTVGYLPCGEIKLIGPGAEVTMRQSCGRNSLDKR